VIIDAHCHAWARWPYAPAPPNPAQGDAATLLFAMNDTGIDRAIVICASIGDNPRNYHDARAAAGRSGGRLIPFADFDCRWHDTHQRPGAADRLHRLVAERAPAGITHYMHEDADAHWLAGPDGVAFLRAAEAHRLPVSLACGPAQLPAITRAAAMAPGLPILLHHLVRVRAGDAAALAQAVAAAALPNLHVKFSGFGYGIANGWDFPVAAMRDVARALYDAYGPERIIWGSDSPVSTRYMTHRQSLEIVRHHCDFIPPREMKLVLGGNMARLLDGVSR
jgi:predicted TIM-barrel fold metal-dependent hydrolase